MSLLNHMVVTFFPHHRVPGRPDCIWRANFAIYGGAQAAAVLQTAGGATGPHLQSVVYGGRGHSLGAVFTCKCSLSICLQGDCPTSGQLQVRAALIVALGRCMTWNGGSEAPAILRVVKGSWLEDALHAVQPAALAYL